MSTSKHGTALPFAATTSTAMDGDDDEWQSMPVQQSSSVDNSRSFDTYTNPNDLLYGDEDQQNWSDPDDPRRFKSLPSRSSKTHTKSRKTIFPRSKTASEHTPTSATSANKHATATNATGRHLDINDARGYDWRAKPANAADVDDADSDGEKGYTQLRLDEDEEGEELHAATEYLFQDGSRHDPYGDHTTATPLNQMNTTKQLLSEGQKIAYVGLCSLLASEMVRSVRRVPGKGLDSAKDSIQSWRLKVLARLYQHMDIEPSEQKMIESLAEHGVLPTDLAPSLVTTQTIDNPDFDPDALRERQEEEEEEARAAEQAELARASIPESGLPETKDSLDLPRGSTNPFGDQDESVVLETAERPLPQHEDDGDIGLHADDDSVVSDTQPPTIADPNTASQLANAGTAVDSTAPLPTLEVGTTLGLTKEPQPVEPPPGALDGVTTSISSADATITLDLRWTVLCDLFLVLTADSVYDARSRVLLEHIASHLGLTWMDVTKFEKRVTDALEIEEGIESLSDKSAVTKRMLMARKKRMLMMGLATVGGGLVIGLSAGLLAPVIGAGVGAALGAVGVGGTSSFLGGIGGAALITSTGTLGGMTLGGHGMSRRTRSVKTFEFRPIHNNKRVNAIVAVPGFMNGPMDDVRLPFSVIDSIMGDAFSVLWEPDMMQEMGNALGILWNETIVQGVQQVLAATVAGAMFTALAWPLWLTKLGYLIDNPWSNALDRASAAGLILADTLVKRQLGVRPITLVGYSLGARVIFYALLELHRIKAYGIVQNVYIMGAPITAKDETWKEARSVVSGRFVSAFSRTDWILGYLHRAASGGLRSIAGLHPVERVQDVENVDVTHVVPGHLAYRPLMPLVLGELGFRTTADYFDEPEDLNAIPERQVVRPLADDQQLELKTVQTKTGGFGKIWRKKSAASSGASTPTVSTAKPDADYNEDEEEEDDLPPREATTSRSAGGVVHADVVKAMNADETTQRPATPEVDRPAAVSAHVDTEAILRELRDSGIEVRELESSLPPLIATTTSGSTTAAVASVPSPLREVQAGESGGISLTFASYDDDEDEHDGGARLATPTPPVREDERVWTGSTHQEPGYDAGTPWTPSAAQDPAPAAVVTRPGTSHIGLPRRHTSSSSFAPGGEDAFPSSSPSAGLPTPYSNAYFDTTTTTTTSHSLTASNTPPPHPTQTTPDPWATDNPW